MCQRREEIHTEANMESFEKTIVLSSEPIPGWEPEEIREWYMQHHTEAGLARAFAAAHRSLHVA